ncbi:MAG TPA: LPS assembly protein LptD [Terriglobales bacterium]|jgi:LPS-assembly protein|nr:LPS assembly protein LptD [Terriglobales bacterium]
MFTRSRIFITAGLVCHLLLWRGIVTSQTLPPANGARAADIPTAPVANTEEEATIRAVEQEKDGSIYHLRGKAEIDYRTYILHADQITYNSDTGDSELEGHLVLDGGPYDEHVEASHGTYNIRTQVGTFYDVIGTVGLELRKSRYVLATSNPFAFTGKIVEKHGPDRYLVRQGTVTTCELPHPKWLFGGKRISVEVDGTASIHNSDFRLMGIPVFYFPFVSFPVERQRKSGLLIPDFGNSSTKGLIAGDSIYWVFNRSMDVLAGTDYYSKRGWFERANFRWRPSDTSYVFFNYVEMVDRGIGTPPQNQGGEDARFLAERAFGDFRGVANVDYLSSFVFRIAFTDVYTQAIDSEVRSQIFLSNTTNGFHFNGLAERYQNFEVCVPPPIPEPGTCTTITQQELVRILHTPSFFFSSEERQIGNTPLYWSFESAAEGLQRRQAAEIGEFGFSQPGLRTAALVGRFDFAPSLVMPLQWRGWSFRPALTLQDTFYTEEFNAAVDDATGKAANDILNRKSLEASVELRPPAMERVFDRPWLGRKWKHVIEPRMRYDYVTGINNFADILRFDATDVLTNTNEVEYSLVNRIYARHIDPNVKDCDPQSMSTLTIGGVPQVGAVPWELPPNPDAQVCASGPREILSWEIGQKYFFDPTFGNALVAGQRNVFTTTADFTGTAFLDSERRFAPIISRLRVETSPRTNTEWDLDYDLKAGRINSSMALVNYHYGPFTVGGGDAFLRVIDTLAGQPLSTPTDYHQFRVLLGYGQLNKPGLSAATSFGFDANLGALQFATVQTSYTWDCCGLSLEYRRFALGAVRNENQYRFTFTLANIGAFGNLKRQERLY